MELVIIVFIAFVAGWKLNQFLVRVMLERAGIDEKELRRRCGIEEEESSVEQATVIPIKLEKYGEMIYAFRKDNDQFLAQGTTAEVLVKHIKARLTKSSFRLTISKEDGSDLLGDISLLDGKQI